MTLRHQMLRDAGVLPLACAIALSTAGVAGAASSHPDPHNFKRPNPHNFRAHPDPHNFVVSRDAT